MIQYFVTFPSGTQITVTHTPDEHFLDLYTIRGDGWQQSLYRAAVPTFLRTLSEVPGAMIRCSSRPSMIC